MSNRSTSTAYEQKHFGKDLRAEANDPFEMASPFDLEFIYAPPLKYHDAGDEYHPYSGALFIFLKESEV